MHTDSSDGTSLPARLSTHWLLLVDVTDINTDTGINTNTNTRTDTDTNTGTNADTDMQQRW